jgi:hypothetical protein
MTKLDIPGLDSFQVEGYKIAEIHSRSHEANTPCSSLHRTRKHRLRKKLECLGVDGLNLSEEEMIALLRNQKYFHDGGASLTNRKSRRTPRKGANVKGSQEQ